MRAGSSQPVFALAALIGLASPASSEADTMCEGIQKILAAAPDEFKPLRAEFDFDNDAYRGTVTLNQLDKCQTESSDGVATYACKSTDFPDDELHAKSNLQAIVRSLEVCLGEQVRQERRVVENAVTLKHVVTKDSIRIRYQRLTSKRRPPVYLLAVGVTTVDPRR